MSQMPNSYEYKPLSGPKCIRILELWPARPKSASLRGRLVDVDIALESQNRPRYDCLSYVWGYDAGDRPINLEGQEVPVTQNCEAALRQLRNKSRSIRIWIDALCINQQNISERNQQVRMMEEIYRKAKHVRIWLNAPESGTWRLIGFRLSLKTNLLVYKLTGNPNGHGSENTAVIGQLFMAHFLPIVLIFGQHNAHYDKRGWSPWLAHHDKMVHSPWLERIWTCQEAAFAQRATVHYGPITCDWKLFSDAVMDWNFEFLSAQRSKSLEDLYSFRKACNQMVLHGNIDSEGSYQHLVDDMLNGLRQTKASDPKDKVFGIHALLQTLDIRLPAPDYTKSVSQIFGEAAVAIHRKRGCLKLRHYFDPLDNPHSLPSWVPDLSKLDYPIFHERRKYHESIFPFQASLNSKNIGFNFFRSDQLIIKAHIIDTVAESGLIFPHDAKDLSTQEITSVLNNWKKMATDVRANLKVKADDGYSEVKDLELLAVVLLYADSLIYHFNTPELVAWLQDEKRANDIDGINSSAFEQYIRPSWEGQRIFRSESNKLGLGGGATSAGDLVVLAAGCDVPLVVRKSGEFYTYIGPTYFPHAMRGELWVSPDDVLIDMILA